jgi:hypothetical protein
MRYLRRPERDGGGSSTLKWILCCSVQAAVFFDMTAMANGQSKALFKRHRKRGQRAPLEIFPVPSGTFFHRSGPRDWYKTCRHAGSTRPLENS